MTPNTEIHSLLQALVKVGAEGSPGPALIAEAERLLAVMGQCPEAKIRDRVWSEEARAAVRAVEDKYDISVCSSEHLEEWIDRCEQLKREAVMVERIKRAMNDPFMAVRDNGEIAEIEASIRRGARRSDHRFKLDPLKAVGADFETVSPPALDTAARVGDARTDLLRRIMTAEMASCSCATKTPELKHHEPACRYRVLNECAEYIASIPTPTGRAEALEEASKDLAMMLKRMISQIRKRENDNDILTTLANNAVVLLRKHDLQGSPLRGSDEQ